MKKVLIIETNVDRYQGANIRTGIWLDEVTTPYDVLTQAGFEVDFASVKGGEVPVDPHSAQADARTMEIYQSSDFQKRALTETKKLSDVDADTYAAVYFAGGHGAMWDFPNAADLQSVARTVYANGGFIASICHGEVGLMNLKDSDGEFLIRGKEINGFTDEEEAANGTADKVPFAAEAELKKRGCKFVKGAPFTSFAVRDGQFITGQNPMSAERVSRMLSDALSEM